jgi:hypothetical protein
MSLYRDARDAVLSMWTANWPAPAGVPVYWHENTENILPDDPVAIPRWVHVAVEFDADGLRAFGGGIGANERALFGSVVVRVFAARGIGEDAALDLLSDAAGAFRGKRSADGLLSFIGASTFPAPLARMDGLWWQRSSLAVFEYRYQS